MLKIVSQKTVFIKSSNKIPNKQIFYNIDALNAAIHQGCKVSVKLLEYGINHELIEKKILQLQSVLMLLYGLPVTIIY